MVNLLSDHLSVPYVLISKLQLNSITISYIAEYFQLVLYFIKSPFTCSNKITLLESTYAFRLLAKAENSLLQKNKREAL
jgi:hypothetical protein